MGYSDKSAYGVLAKALDYPYPGLTSSLQTGASEIPGGAARKDFETFLGNIQGFSLGEWEELYTRTFDLNPAVAPYVGYQLWGDGYPRGNFMAVLKRTYRSAELDLNGELPDYLGSILKYLGTGSPPPPELVEAFEPALQKMIATLRKKDADNPYIDLFEAVIRAVDLEEVRNA